MVTRFLLQHLMTVNKRKWRSPVTYVSLFLNMNWMATSGLVYLAA